MWLRVWTRGFITRLRAGGSECVRQLPQDLVPRHDGWSGPLRRRSARQAKFWAGRWRREQRSGAWFAALAWDFPRLTRRWPFP